MSKPIVSDKCNLCKDQEDGPMCVQVCPVSVFKKGAKKSEVAKPDECIGCGACEVQCPQEAIKVQHD